MTLLAYGPAATTEPIIRVELEADGSLTIELELPLGVEIHRVPAMSVAPAVRAIASQSEAAA